MTKRVFAALAIAVAAPAIASTPISFEQDGQKFVGSVEERNGVRYISGHEVGSNQTFRLRVAKGWVTGDYAGNTVSYPEPIREAVAR